MTDARRKFLTVLLAFASAFFLGTLGYMVIEGWSFGDAFYMTAITLTTTGFGEVRPLSFAGRMFTIGLLGFGVGSVLYGLTLLGEFMINAGMAGDWRRRRTMKLMQKLKGHIIVCGYGRVGWAAALTLRDNKRTVVIIDPQPDLIPSEADRGLLLLDGDATRDDVLKQAGIEQAYGLIAATGKDADNLLVVLSARALNPDLHIVARATAPENEHKMMRAGANRIVSPYRMGGQHMANLVIRPQITDFLDFVTLDTGQELWLEQVEIHPDSTLVGKTAVEANFRQLTGVNLIALRRKDAGNIHIPDEDTKLSENDTLIALGTRLQLASLEQLAKREVSR